MSVIFSDSMADREIAVRREQADECSTGDCQQRDDGAELGSYMADRIVEWFCAVGLVGVIAAIVFGWL